MDRTSSYELESRTSSLFGTLRTLCLTDGVRAACGAMLHLVRTIYPSIWAGQPDEPRRYTILAARNVSADFLAACAMLDMDVAWLYPEDVSLDRGTALGITPEAVYDALEQSMADAFYVTVPDTLGSSCDLFGISEACHARDIPLLVDNSAGAYLYFIDDGHHPMQLGADMCFDSASHLLPGLAGAAWLHIAPGAADLYASRLQAEQAGLSYSQVQQRLIANARVSAALYSSAQPSDEITRSMDACVKRLRADGDLPQAIAAMASRLDKLKEHLCKIDVAVPESDPLRVVIDARSLGETGASLRELYELAVGPAPEESMTASIADKSDVSPDMSRESSDDHDASPAADKTSSSATEKSDVSMVMSATPCVPAAYADNRYLIFLVAPGTSEQEIAQIFRIASRIKHAKQTGKAITWYLLTGTPEPEKPEGTEDEENLDDFTDISELEAFEAENDDKLPDEFDVSDAEASNEADADGIREDAAGFDAAGSEGAGGNDANGSSADSGVAGNRVESAGAYRTGETSYIGKTAGAGAASAPEVVIEDIAAEIVYPAPDMSDPGTYILRPLERACSVRDAIFAEHTRIDIDESAGKVCAVPVSCHPAWTIIAPGERIDENTIAIMKSYGIGYAEVSSLNL